MGDLTRLRVIMDRLDKQIVKLLNKRAKIADEIGKVKERLGLEVYSPEREKQVIENVGNENPGPLTDDAVKRVYERIIDESRRLERESAEERRTSMQPNFRKRFLGKRSPGENDLHLMTLKNVAIFIAVTITAFVLTTAGIFLIPYHFAHGRGTVIAIDKGMSAEKVYSRLSESDLISNKLVFKVLSRAFSVEHKIKAGKYLFEGHFSDFDVMKIIASGKSNLLVTVTIPEGLTIRQIASIYQREIGTDSTQFVNVALDDSIAAAFGIPSEDFEGYLFPQSYDFYYGTPPEEIIRRMVDEFDLFLNDTLKLEASRRGFTIPQVIKMASIIEDEARVDSERAIIAGVYYNRLEKHIPLESDPTIQYALGERKRVYYKDLRVNSPYNTYRRIGLPPTPICNPGAKSILAALYPAKTNYLYFVANGRGGHIFSDTYEEHLRAVRSYKRTRSR